MDAQISNDTSAMAREQLGWRRIAQSSQEILDIVLAAARNGTPDMSGKEIQSRFEYVHGRRIDAAIISARIADLVAASRIERCRMTRPCRVTGKQIHPVRPIAHQTRMEY